MANIDFTAKVLSVRANETGALLDLWESVKRFIAKAAYKWACYYGRRVSHDDLMQAGFIALVDAVNKFDPDRENASFLSVLYLTLKTRFKEELGIKTTKRDILQYATSIDNPTFSESDDITIADTLSDKGASLAYTGVEYKDFIIYCRGVINAAFETITESQANILRLHYFKGLTLERIAELRSLSSKQAVNEIKQRGLDRLASGKYRRELRDCMSTLAEFRAEKDATKAYMWYSPTERAALMNI